jgi:hypothetical protein
VTALLSSCHTFFAPSTSKATRVHWHVVQECTLGAPSGSTCITEDWFLWRSISPQGSCCRNRNTHTHTHTSYRNCTRNTWRRLHI